MIKILILSYLLIGLALSLLAIISGISANGITTSFDKFNHEAGVNIPYTVLLILVVISITIFWPKLICEILRERTHHERK